MHRHVRESPAGVGPAGGSAGVRCGLLTGDHQPTPAAPGQEGEGEGLGPQTGAGASDSLCTDGETGTPVWGRTGDYDQTSNESNLRYAVGDGVWELFSCGFPGGVNRVGVCGSRRTGLFTEVMNSECMPDRDYQGWVDFGRRDAEWDATATTSEPPLLCVHILYFNRKCFTVPATLQINYLAEFLQCLSVDSRGNTRHVELYLMKMQSFIHRWFTLHTRDASNRDYTAEKQWFGWWTQIRTTCVWFIPFCIHKYPMPFTCRSVKNHADYININNFILLVFLLENISLNTTENSLWTPPQDFWFHLHPSSFKSSWWHEIQQLRTSRIFQSIQSVNTHIASKTLIGCFYCSIGRPDLFVFIYFLLRFGSGYTLSPESTLISFNAIWQSYIQHAFFSVAANEQEEQSVI